jgi:hypothetical protein
MSVIIFVGPTLQVQDIRRALPQATCFPPVAHGDVYRASKRRPAIIGIIDGHFERTPAVWHKEILWAMSQGVHVFGSASMGALRAAELAAFGMEGVGAIFNAFRAGELTDDDEVAVAETARGSEYVSASDAMVNIRATFGEAVRQGVIRRQTERVLLQLGKRLFYPERNYAAILAAAQGVSIPAHEVKALRAWLPDHRIDQKRDDALAMLRVISERLAAGVEPKAVDYQFQHTEVWRQAVLAAGAAGDARTMRSPGTAAGGAALPTDSLLDELRLQGVPYLMARGHAVSRFLAIQYAVQQGVRPDAEAIREEARRFRETRGLLDEAEHEAWMADHNLTRDEFLQLIVNAVLVEWTSAAVESSVLPQLIEHVISSGEFGALLTRARHKQRLLAESEMDQLTLADADMTEEALFAWYFEHCLKLERSASPASYAQLFGYRCEEDFQRAVLREYLYNQTLSRGSTV